MDIDMGKSTSTQENRLFTIEKINFDMEKLTLMWNNKLMVEKEKIDSNVEKLISLWKKKLMSI